MKKYLSLYPKYYCFNLFKVIGGINYSVKNLSEEMKNNDTVINIREIKIPIKLIFGETDYICPIEPAREWFNSLNAPKKDLVVIKKAAHMVNFEQPKQWVEEIIACLNQ